MIVVSPKSLIYGQRSGYIVLCMRRKVGLFWSNDNHLTGSRFAKLFLPPIHWKIFTGSARSARFAPFEAAIVGSSRGAAGKGRRIACVVRSVPSRVSSLLTCPAVIWTSLPTHLAGHGGLAISRVSLVSLWRTGYPTLDPWFLPR